MSRISPKMQRAALSAAFVLFALLLPVTLRAILRPAAYPTALNIAVLGAYFSICAIGLNIIVGYCGLLNLGFAGFMLIGSYTTAILCTYLGWSFWVALPLAAVHGALWGVLLGLPTLRLTGDYFAIVTFGFGELVNMVARNWIAVTRGPSGIQGVPRPVVDLSWLGIKPYTFGIGASETGYWYLVAALLGGALFMTSRLSRSRLGRAWRALREDEVAAEACGIYAAWYKTLAFAVSAAVGAVAGGFFTAYLASAHYVNFEFMVSVTVLAYVVLGGMGTVFGPVLGAVLLYTMGELLRRSPATYVAPLFGWWPAGQEWLLALPWASEMRMIIYGIVLILVVRFRPEGLLPSRSRARELHTRTAQDDIDTSLFNLQEASK